MKPWKGIRRFFVQRAIEPKLLDPETGGGIVLPLFLDRGRAMLILTLQEATSIVDMLDRIMLSVNPNYKSFPEERPPENNGASVAELD